MSHERFRGFSEPESEEPDSERHEGLRHELRSNASDEKLVELAGQEIILSSREQSSTPPPVQSDERKMTRREFIRDSVTGASAVTGIYYGGRLLYLERTGRILKEGEEKVLSESKTEDAYIKLIKQSSDLSERQERNLREKIKFVSGQFSPKIIKTLMIADEESAEFSEKAMPPSVQGFKEHGGVPDQIMKELWTEGDRYPEGCVKGQIESISADYVDQEKHSMVRYGLHSHSVGTADRLDDEIVFHFDPKEGGSRKSDVEARDTLGDWDETFSHELGHMNDWLGANDLTAQERLELLHNTTRSYLVRYRKDDFLKWDYPDRITKEGVHATRLAKVTEWWAEVNADYYQRPDVLRRARPELYSLVNKHATRKGAFNPVEAKKKRVEFIKNATR